MKHFFNTKLAIIYLLSLMATVSCKKEDDELRSVTDIDGNVYHTVKIGSQVWMVENLRSFHFRNGDPIPTTSPATLDYSGETDPVYQWAYNGDEVLAEEYGRLYTWYAVTDSRGICPKGWHVPADSEWETLLNTLGGIDEAAAKLIEAGTDHWPADNTDATNESGFTALPGGNRPPMLVFFNIDLNGSYWTSSPLNDNIAYYYFFAANSAHVSRASYHKNFGYSVRCIKDR